MKKIPWHLGLLLFSLAGLNAQNLTLTDEIEQARKDDVSAAAVTRQLIDRGERAEEVTQIVAQVYGNCRDTTLAVAAATEAAPRSAESIVIAVAGLENCGCTADTMFGRSRVEERLRLPLTRRLVELQDRDACAAAAAQGGVFELPERSGSLVEAALIAKQESLLPEDSVGSLNTDRERADWSAALPEAATVFRRRTDVCRGDQNPRDTFVPAEQWEILNDPDPTSPWAPDCDDEEEVEDDEFIDQVLITEFALGGDQPNYVKFYNGNDHPIRLDRLGYRLLVSAPGSEVAGAMVPLRGEVPPGGIFVLGDERMPAGSLDQLALGLSIKRGDALILDLGWEARTCDAITAIVAGAYRAAEDEGELGSQVAKSALIRHKLARHFGALQGQTPGWVTDAVGQVPLVERDDDEPVPPLRSPLSRVPRQCSPDGNETDSFDVLPPWQFSEGTDLGTYPPSCPPSDEPQLVISELVNGDEEDDALEMFNGTPAHIDLNKGGYYLEIFRNGERDPSEVIQLEGVIGPGSAFVVANPDTDDATREAANQVTGQLNLAEASAVLLIRESVPSARQCDQIALAALLGPSQVTFVRIPDQEPPIRVDPPASPN